MLLKTELLPLSTPLGDVVRIARKTNEFTRSMGVGFTPCSLPQTGEPSFEIGDNEMELGLGHHGEPGIKKSPMDTADNIADKLLEYIFADMPLNKDDEVAVLVNGLGSIFIVHILVIILHHLKWEDVLLH